MEINLPIHKAQRRLVSEEVESANILIDREVPSFDRLEDADAVYLKDAQELCAVLYATLPGGTFDRLLGEMLKIKASHFRVSFSKGETS